MAAKKRIMIFCDSYLPGYTSGGAREMIINLIDRFSDRFDFYVVTRNFDSRSDTTPFTTVKTDEWNHVGNASVFYFSPRNLRGSFFGRLVDEIKPDLYFLNSTFSTPTVVLLRARKKAVVPPLPTIIASCGSLSAASLSFKALKKRMFLRYAAVSGLFRDIIWKASFESEKEDIVAAIGANAYVLVAPDLLPRTILPDYKTSWNPTKIRGSVKFVYFSRLERKKNVLFFLERLKEVGQGMIEFSFIGPMEDQGYWAECQSVIAQLPPNVKVFVRGTFPEQADALRKVAENHFFVLPTLNENFGYVFIESLAAGCPNITSDRTVWTDLEEKGAGWRIPLDDTEAWDRTIRECVEMNDKIYRELSAAARTYALDWLANPDTEEATAAVLREALNTNASFADVR